MMHLARPPEAERRKYIRLNSVFPVQFRLESVDGKNFLSGWMQGFTNNIGKGGICLSVNNFNPDFAKLLKLKQARLSLELEMPISRTPIGALAKIAWVSDDVNTPNKYLIGLSYEEIDPIQNKNIVYFAWTRKLFAPVVLGFIFLLSLGFALNIILNIQLMNGNKAVVEQLVKIVQESSIAKQKVKEISKQREDLQLKIDSLQLQIRTAQEEKSKIAEKEAHTAENINELNKLTEQLTKERNTLQEQLIALQQKESTVTEDLLHLDKRRAVLEKANFEKMYQWLKAHQNSRTGLLSSFEGDDGIADWAFIYDQALALQAFTKFSDFNRAKKMLEFFNSKAKRIDGRFLNAYYASDGSPAEYIVHSGPNIWVAISILQYTHKSKDNTYLKLAEEVADSVIYLLDRDPTGGVPGGPNISWYSTEHNLDAYALFDMLYTITGKENYLRARDKVLNWLVQHTYDKSDIPVKRGRGDSTISTDTYAWSIAAIGPKRLQELGMNPDRILEFAETNCATAISYKRPGGRVVKVKGFDFAPQRNLARGGVVSSEWSAQMIIAFKIMSEFYYKKSMIAKARAYGLKADEYLTSLANMIITSPSPSGQGEGCLPYASEDFVDTGHGWMTPKGDRTGSVSATAYALFAFYNYNPLQLQK